MTRIVKFFGLAAGLYAVVSVSAQTGAESGTRFGIGQDSITCVRHLSLYTTDFQQARQAIAQRQPQASFDAALTNWRRVWRDCPMALLNLTPQGAEMYRFYIDRELNHDRRNALIDTLFQVWERGITLRADNPNVQAQYQQQLMQDMLRYADTPENEERILALLRDMAGLHRDGQRRGPTAGRPRPTAGMYANYWRIRFSQNREGRLSDDELVEIYDIVVDALSEAINETNDEEMARARDMIDDAFANSPAASRETLVRIYGGRRFEENRDNPQYLRRVTRLLSQREYTDSELFESASERLYELDPSPAAAHGMAMLFLRRDNFDRALEYFEEAIRLETNPFEKARYNFALGGIMLSRFNRHADARRYTKEAIRLRPDWGEPYILLAQIYADGPRCGNDDFEQRQVFWVIVDLLTRARTVDPDLASRVDPLIRQYQQHFPRREEGFFRNINEGMTVTVGCWISESTRVRYIN